MTLAPRLLILLLAVSSGCIASAPDKPDSPYGPAPEAAWSVPLSNTVALASGDWDGDGGDEAIVLFSDRTVGVYDLSGTVVDLLTLDTDTTPLDSLAFGRSSEGPRLSVFSAWGRAVETFDAAGDHLFSVEDRLAVNIATWGDHNGDGEDDLVVGYNGPGGLVRFDHTGTLTGAAGYGSGWHEAPDYHAANLGNVWCLDVAPAQDDHAGAVAAIDGHFPILLSESMAVVHEAELDSDVSVVEAFRSDDGDVWMATVMDGQVLALDPARPEAPVFSVPGLDSSYARVLDTRRDHWLTSGTVDDTSLLAFLDPDGFTIVDDSGDTRAQVSLGTHVWQEFVDNRTHTLHGMGLVEAGPTRGLLALRDGYLELFPL